MPTTLRNTDILFNDGSTQSTAASATAIGGIRGQVFTSNGTFTIPANVTALKITVIGGGGGGGGTTGNGGTGGTSSVASGSQSITTISASGGAGGNTSNVGGAGGIGSNGSLNIRGNQAGLGNQGGMGASSLFPGSGSPFSGGTINGSLGGGGGQSSSCGPGGAGGAAISYLTGLTPGATLSVTTGSGGNRSSSNFCGCIVFSGFGGAGVVVFEW
jgi:hypothetical protein